MKQASTRVISLDNLSIEFIRGVVNKFGKGTGPEISGQFSAGIIFSRNIDATPNVATLRERGCAMFTIVF